MFSPPLISQLFTRDLQKYIIQGGHFREYSSEWNVLALKIIQDPDQIMLRILYTGLSGSGSHNVCQKHAPVPGFL